ncbi:Mu-like prophage major head subunit gpT [Symmachiella macrocystis]|uniref:Mu-like prophage major head subunit gpT n=1 Tax=Symmachiella macrocystis TaxID=2527985 RepID=A0A5C6BU81_9PLAN|nr:Mu-like prophage major head subunit gpT family protein [Symmachiella macrocystis]TWU14746.1 Mu-like prophage major head subunit gpT [Symmachiella macrocystis]
MSTATIDEILFTAGSVDIQAAGQTHPEVSILAYSGGLMTVPGWGPVVIDLRGIDIPAAQVGILADHDSSLKGIVGHGRASVHDGRLIVAGAISPSSETARQIIELAKGGFRFQASVGVTPTDYERVPPGQSIEANGRSIKSPASGFLFVKFSTLREASIVAIGADASTSVAIAASQKESQMPEETTTPTAEQIREQAASETERITAIRRVCGGRYVDIEATAIRDGWDVQQAELAALRESRPKPPIIHARDHAPTNATIEAAILSHMGCEGLAEEQLGPQAMQQARDLRCTNLVDLCHYSLQADGRDTPQGREAMIQAALTTYSLPVALGNAANKVLFESYSETPATWRAFAAIKSAKDFKDHTGVRPSDTGDLSEVAKGGELKHGSIDESTYTYSVDTFGKMLSIDRRDIINDDLSMFDDTARSLGRAAMRSLSDLVYKVLLANAGSFFAGGNGNYDEGVETALDAAALAIGLARMMAQRDDENRDLDIRARTLLVPSELQQTAKELLQSDFIQRANDDTPTGNALKNAVSLEVEPRLSNAQRFAGTSAKAWYLFGSRQDAALIVAFLQGKQSPTVEFFGFDADPNRLAATWRVYFDYGCALGDFRAAYKAKGEA